MAEVTDQFAIIRQRHRRLWVKSIFLHCNERWHYFNDWF